MKKIIFLICVSVLFFSSLASAKSIEKLSLEDKKVIAEYVFSVMDAFIKGESIPELPVNGRIDSSLDYDNLFISLYRKNMLLDSWGFAASKNTKNGLFIDLKNAVIKCIEDKISGITSDNKLSKDIYIVLSFLYNKKKMKRHDLGYLTNNLELGIHSISVHKGSDQAYYISSIPITNSINLKTTLKQICLKAGLEQNCYLDHETRINRYDTQVFKTDAKANIINLYRFNIYVDTKELTQERIFESLSLTKNWFLNNLDGRTGLLEYIYYPSKDKYAKENNEHTRQIATLWALTELRGLLKTTSLDSIIKNTADYYLQHQIQNGNYAYIAVEKDPTIGFNAFLIMALLNMEMPQKEDIMNELARGIISLQLPDGSYQTNFISKKIYAVDYLPGEAMLALMKLYTLTENKEYLDSVQKAFYYYRNYWRKNKNTAFVPWHTQADYLLYQAAKNNEVAEFIFEMNDWLIDKHQIFANKYSDKIGGCPKNNPSACSTAVFLEGINNAYSLAKELKDRQHQKKYSRSISEGIRFIIQAQFNADNSFYLKNPKKAIGGIRGSFTNSSQRVDCVQHSVMALLKTYHNKLFE